MILFRRSRDRRLENRTLLLTSGVVVLDRTDEWLHVQPFFSNQTPARKIMSQNIDQRLLEDLADIAVEAGCELLHVEFVAGTLRIILEHPEAVTLEHCETVSRQASQLLDTVDYGPERYTLEVSSPGLDRQLYRPADYERFVGKALKLTFRDDSGKKQTIRGRLDGFEAGSRCDGSDGLARVLEQDRSELLEIPLKNIQVARLQVEI